MLVATNDHNVSAEEIRTRECPRCDLCGATGEILYRQVEDRLFRVSGSWSFKECSNSQCGLIWLDPMPVTEDLVKAYAKYYTHAASNADEAAGFAKSLYRKVKQQYLAEKYGSLNGQSSRRGISLGQLFYLLPLRRKEADAELRTLTARAGGRLLDVGCGTGQWLASMRDRGWEVEGVEFDRSAAAVAEQQGLRVRCGSLQEQNFPAGSFDAITLNHVIEHVPDPVETVNECRRLLRAGGRLVISTPNSASLGHKLFHRSWRGLEPPRHLHVFSMTSLRGALEKAGFTSVQLLPQVASSVIYESILLRRGNIVTTGAPATDLSARVFTWLLNRVELLLIKSKPSVADCVTAVALV